MNDLMCNTPICSSCTRSVAGGIGFPPVVAEQVNSSMHTHGGGYASCEFCGNSTLKAVSITSFQRGILRGALTSSSGVSWLGSIIRRASSLRSHLNFKSSLSGLPRSRARRRF